MSLVNSPKTRRRMMVASAAEMRRTIASVEQDYFNGSDADNDITDLSSSSSSSSNIIDLAQESNNTSMNHQDEHIRAPDEVVYTNLMYDNTYSPPVYSKTTSSYDLNCPVCRKRNIISFDAIQMVSLERKEENKCCTCLVKYSNVKFPKCGHVNTCFACIKKISKKMLPMMEPPPPPPPPPRSPQSHPDIYSNDADVELELALALSMDDF